MKSLFLVVPCYNEEEVLLETARLLSAKLIDLIRDETISRDSRILFVDDGSKDKSWEIIKQLHTENALITGICLSHNKGQQNALFAGLMTAKEHADIMISIDADLQDDLIVIDKMMNEYNNGNEIVYGVKITLNNETRIRKFLANSFYRTVKMMGVDMVTHNSSCRLMGRRAVEALSAYGEVNLFLPGLVPLLGFKNAVVHYNQKERVAGKTKYSLGTLFSLAAEAITSFSFKPLRFIVFLGTAFLLVFIGFLIYLVFQALTGRFDGWALVMASVWATGAALLLSLGIIGEYIGKSYSEVKKRPRYFISETLFDEKK